TYELGTLHVVVGSRQLIAQLRDSARAIATTTFLTLIGSSLMLLLLFRLWVTRHLMAMAEYARGLSFSKLDVSLDLPAKTPRIPPAELDQLVLSCNAMREALGVELQARDRDQQELLLHRERLESLVQERTAELADKNEQLAEQRDAMQRLANADFLTGV